MYVDDVKYNILFVLKSENPVNRFIDTYKSTISLFQSGNTDIQHGYIYMRIFEIVYK